jgi:Arc/MetJ-type ribon-helix-helix transcriptional regulator
MTRMKIITINLPIQYIQAIQSLQDLGMCDSRSSAIRTALRDFLGEELKTFNNLETETFKKIIISGGNRN